MTKGRETVVAVLLRMDEQIQQLTKQVAKQDERIAELERRLDRNSRNSSVPPSQNPPGAPERKRPDPSGRAQGAVPRKRDIKQLRQACKEVGLTAIEQYEASEALHGEKASGAAREHMSYGELLAWLRQWKQR